MTRDYRWKVWNSQMWKCPVSMRFLNEEKGRVIERSSSKRSHGSLLTSEMPHKPNERVERKSGSRKRSYMENSRRTRFSMNLSRSSRWRIDLHTTERRQFPLLLSIESTWFGLLVCIRVALCENSLGRWLLSVWYRLRQPPYSFYLFLRGGEVFPSFAKVVASCQARKTLATLALSLNDFWALWREVDGSRQRPFPSLSDFQNLFGVAPQRFLSVESDQFDDALSAWSVASARCSRLGCFVKL